MLLLSGKCRLYMIDRIFLYLIYVFFYRDLNACASAKESDTIPFTDQHRALALLLELAVQRGTLSHLLDAVLLLLQLWDNGVQERDNRTSPRGTTAPLVPLLKRLQNIPNPKGVFPHEATVNQSNEVCAQSFKLL